MKKNEKKGPNFLGRHGPILRLFLNSFDFLDFQNFLAFFDLTSLQDPCVFYKSGEVAQVEGAAAEGQGQDFQADKSIITKNNS